MRRRVYMLWGIYVSVGLIVWPSAVYSQAVSGAESSGLAEPEERTESEPASTPTEQADGETAVDGLVRLGGEWDTNAGRVAPVDAAVSDGLLRYFLSLQGDVYDDGRNRVRLDLRQGGKAFVDRRSNDALLTSLDMSLARRLSRAQEEESEEQKAPARWYWVVDARMKDRIERESKQDYSRGSLKTGVRMRKGRVAVRGTAGWGFFAFRPNPAASSHGPRGTLSSTVWIGKDWYLRPAYTLAWRLFQSTRFVLQPTSGGEEVPQRDRTGLERRDVLHVGRVSGGYRGDFVVRGTYELLVNRSNSYGQRLVRHGVIVDSTFSIPWEMYISARLELQRTNYEDPIFVGRDFTVDENNRNAAILAVTRSFGRHWDLEARWRGFIEEFGATADYRRQTVGLSVGYGW